MVRALLILIILCCSQTASAKRWQGMIASVAALESVKIQDVEPMQKCTGADCPLTLKPVIAVDINKPVKPPKVYTRRRFQPFWRR